MPGSNAPRAGGPRRPIDQFATTLDSIMVPLDKGFSYTTTLAISEEDLREFIHDPVASLPPKVCDIIAPVRIVLVPFLERNDAAGVPTIFPEAPPEHRRLRSAYLLNDNATLFFSVRDERPSDYHHVFFNTLAHLLSRRVDKDLQGTYAALLLTEMDQHVNGEVDEPSWARKQSLPRRVRGGRPNTASKAFREYVAQSFADTMTLYLHGICCDIDVETGPRQVPSRWLRKRLEKLYLMFPPPPGRAVLPEHLSRR